MKMILSDKIITFNLDDIIKFYGNKKNIKKNKTKNLDVNTKLKTYHLDYL